MGVVEILQSYKSLAMFGVLFLCGLGLPVPEEITLLASGLAVALYPAAAIGTGLLVGSPDAFTGLVGFGAEVVGALGRNRLLTLGEGLDAAESGLIVAAAPERESAVRKVIGRAEAVESDHTTLDHTHLERTMRDAWREAVA